MVDIPAAPQAFDSKEFLERIGDDPQLAQDLIDLLLRDLPSLVEAVHNAVRSNDAKAVQHAAHTLKGAVANFAAEAATQAAQGIEAMGRAGTLAGAPAALPPLRHELDRLVQDLSAYRSAHAGRTAP